MRGASLSRVTVAAHLRAEGRPRDDVVRSDRYSQAHWQEAADSRNKAQIGLVAWGADYARASNFFTPNFTCRSFQPHSPSNLNVAEFCDHKIDAEIKNALAQQLTNPEGTSSLWAKIDRDVVGEAPWVPLYTPAQPDFLSKRTGNYQVSPQWGVLLDQLWVR
jgi:peptide/nickel transport system substrate-binding protein